MFSYDADYKFPERGPLEAFYGHGFQPPKKGEGAEPMEMDQAEAYGESMNEPWPPSPNDAPVPQAPTMFSPFMSQCVANSGVEYNAYEGAMFPGILDSQQPGLQLDRDQIDQQLRLQRLAEYSNQLSASHASQKPQANMATRSSSAAQAIQPPTQPPRAAASQASLPQNAPQPTPVPTAPSSGPSPPPATTATTSEPAPARPAASSESASRRQAHNLVERKYRDTLNGELVRLRQAIPHIRDLDAETPEGRSRASKATVLAAAADYIARLIGEVEGLTEENALLRSRAGLGPPPSLARAATEEEGDGGGGRGGRGRGCAVGRLGGGRRGGARRKGVM